MRSYNLTALKMRILIASILTAQLVLLPIHAVAQDSKADELRSMEMRPTVQDMLTKLNPWPEKNPFNVTDQRTADFLDSTDKRQTKTLEVLFRQAPQVIATFEYIHPGATYAPLGRDMVVLGDVLDAFYTGIGQPNRVSRLNASGRTLRFHADMKWQPTLGDESTVHYVPLTGEQASSYAHQPTTAELYLRFLAKAGFDINKAHEQPPFIMFDATGYGTGSQIRRLLEVVYTEWVRRGGNRVDLLKKFNAFRISEGSSAVMIDPPEKYLSNDILNDQFSAPSQIIPLSVASDRKIFTYVSTREWHAEFNQFSERNGEVFATPGPARTPESREVILWEMFELIERVRDPAFLQLVRDYATQLGYEFPMERIQSAVLPKPEYKIKDAAEAYRSIISALAPLPPETKETQKYFTPNAKQMVDWFEIEQQKVSEVADAENVISLFLEGVVTTKNDKKITSKDYRRLLANALAQLNQLTEGGHTPSDAFIEWFVNFSKKDPTFGNIWHDRAAYFINENPKRRGGSHVPQMFSKLVELTKGRVDFPDRRTMKVTGLCSNAFIPPIRTNLF